MACQWVSTVTSQLRTHSPSSSVGGALLPVTEFLSSLVDDVLGRLVGRIGFARRLVGGDLALDITVYRTVERGPAERAVVVEVSGHWCSLHCWEFAGLSLHPESCEDTTDFRVDRSLSLNPLPQHQQTPMSKPPIHFPIRNPMRRD